MDSHPMVWMVEVDGFIHEARNLPLGMQEIAYEKGLIPSIPALKEVSSARENPVESASVEDDVPARAPVQKRRQRARSSPEPENGQLGLFSGVAPRRWASNRS
jgi:hypothetical protein